MATKEQSLVTIRSTFEEEPPTTHDLLWGIKNVHTYARGMVDLHIALFPYDGDKEHNDLRVEVWESIFPTPPKTFADLIEEQGWNAESVATIAREWANSDRMITLDEWARNVADAENADA